MPEKLRLSPLGHTWILDVDGTLCVHNGYLTGEDVLLPGVKELFASIPPEDYILLLTSRKESERNRVDAFMNRHGLRYDKLLMDMPMGERILVNDDKPSGLPASVAVRKKRDAPMPFVAVIDGGL